jgi:thiol-disulfide isomerase/thioredoxin
MNKKFLLLFFMLFYTAGSGHPQGLGLSGEELAAFNVTVYAEKELLPLGGLATLDGRPYDSGVLRGKYVLVNMGATWCPYCGREKPSVERLHSGYFAGEKFAVLAIFLNERTETARGYMRERGYSFPAAVDTTNRLRERYAPRIPATYLLDPEGYIIARVNGDKEWDSEVALRLIGNALAGLGR